MFRSAALAYGERVAGVLLTGLLDDGAAGLWEIQQKNGATIVHDPSEATFRSMPDSAILGLNVQYIVRAAEMGPLLTRLALADQNPISSAQPEESRIEQTMQTCPECGGAMAVATMGQLQEFRCHVGHRFGLRTMIEQRPTTSSACWRPRWPNQRNSAPCSGQRWNSRTARMLRHCERNCDDARKNRSFSGQFRGIRKEKLQIKDQASYPDSAGEGPLSTELNLRSRGVERFTKPDSQGFP